MEYILGAVIVGLIVKDYLKDREGKVEREQFMKALMAKTLQEYTESETIKEEPEEKVPDEVPIEQADDKLWDKHLQAINGQDNETNYS